MSTRKFSPSLAVSIGLGSNGLFWLIACVWLVATDRFDFLEPMLLFGVFAGLTSLALSLAILMSHFREQRNHEINEKERKEKITASVR